MRYTHAGEPFPDPRDLSRWNHTPVWPGNDPTANLGYQHQHQAITDLLGELKIVIKKKTHAFRVLSARTLDESGIDDRVRYDIC